MSVLVSCLLASLTLCSPQGAPPAPGQQDTAPGGKAPLLTPAEQENLRGKLIKYLEADDAYLRAKDLKPREKASKVRENAKEDFDKEWGKHEKKGDLVGSMADMRAIFANCFPMKKPAFSTGQLRAEKIKEEGTEYSFFLPKAYVPEKPHRTVLAIPGTATAEGGGNWTKPADWFAAVFDKTNLINSTIVQVCLIPSGLELDPIPDFSREGDEAEEDRRNKSILSVFGHLMASYNVERNAVFLDCGRGACGFGMRFLSTFPDRFAGIVLRQPIEVDDIRLGSLSGKSILMLKTAATAAAVDALAKRLEAITPKGVTVVDATDEYPHRGSAVAIEQWMDKQQRNMTPTKVVIEHNHDRFKRAYWVSVDVAEPLLGTPADTRPRIEVEADRATNRIVVKSRGIEKFTLYLNDDLVDLDKEFTVEVNGKANPETRKRNFAGMRDRMVKRKDWEYLFSVEYMAMVPKPPAEATTEKPEKK